MRTPSICLSVDDETLKAAQSMPGNMSASRLFRHFIKAGWCNDKQWSEYAKTDDYKKCREFMKPYKERLFGK